MYTFVKGILESLNPYDIEYTTQATYIDTSISIAN
jgi:hypothetical protein